MTTNTQADNSTLLVANWKMHTPPCSITEYIEHTHRITHPQHNVVICPPYPYIPLIRQELSQKFSDNILQKNIEIGGQHLHPNVQGSHTGEISAQILRDVGAKYVIIGHSEQRQAHNWNLSNISDMIQSAQACNITPILCIGEAEKYSDLSELQHHLTTLLISVTQIYPSLHPNKTPLPMIAYEPIWAIGADESASLQHIEQTMMIIQSILQKHHLTQISLLYGGSVHADNIRQILSIPNVSGALIGRASYHFKDWIKLLNAII